MCPLLKNIPSTWNVFTICPESLVNFLPHIHDEKLREIKSNSYIDLWEKQVMKLGCGVHYSLFSLRWCWIVKPASVCEPVRATLSAASSSFPIRTPRFISINTGGLVCVVTAGCQHSSGGLIADSIHMAFMALQGAFESYEQGVKSHLTATLGTRCCDRTTYMKNNHSGHRCPCLESWDISISECK